MHPTPSAHANAWPTSGPGAGTRTPVTPGRRIGGTDAGWDRGAMTETSPPTQAPQPRRGRIALPVTGAISGLLATALLLGGGVALWANAKKDDDGYLSASRHEFASRTAALATENLDLDLDGVQWLVDSGDAGKTRLKV